jgi:hypothetical protein
MKTAGRFTHLTWQWAMNCVLYSEQMVDDKREKATSLLKNLEMKAHGVTVLRFSDLDPTMWLPQSLRRGGCEGWS